MGRTPDEILREREKVDERLNRMGRAIRGMPGTLRPTGPEWDELHARRSVLGAELHAARAPERAAAEAAQMRTLRARMSVDAARIADLPVWQRRNGWHIVRDGVKYVLRHPVTLEEVYSGSLKRCRDVADESLPD
jgi:hypothetical protein